jgi:hypothetical protein
MRFIIVKVAVIAAHFLIAFATGIFKHNLVTAHRQKGAIVDSIMLVIKWHYLSPPQPVPRKITAGAENTRAIGYEQHNGELSP